MLTINGLRRFFFLPHFHDMRCKAPRVAEIIRSRYHRDPFNGDVYIFMSKRYDKVKMIHYENHAYYLHEKSFTQGYRFMKVRYEGDKPLYMIDWKDIIAILENPVVREIKIN